MTTHLSYIKIIDGNGRQTKTAYGPFGSSSEANILLESLGFSGVRSLADIWIKREGETIFYAEVVEWTLLDKDRLETDVPKWFSDSREPSGHQS